MIKFQALPAALPYQAFLADMVGLIPSFIDLDDPAPAREQLDRNYAFGGGWRPMPNFELTPQNTLLYPGDPPMRPLAQAKLRDELILIYESGWVAVIQPDRNFEVCRMD
jgi:hypothetical protein